MSEILAERSGSILRLQLNRPEKKNAMTSNMYVTAADVLTAATNDDRVRVVVWHGAGDSFCAGNDVADFLNSPPASSETPQARLMKALVNFDKPLVAAVHGATIGGGATMVTHCDFVYAGESAKFQMPFINLGLVPEFGSSCSIPARIGHIRASELISLGLPFGATRAAELGIVTRVVPDKELLWPRRRRLRNSWQRNRRCALRACKRLQKRSAREQLEQAMRVENEMYATLLRLGRRQGSADGVPGKAAAGLQ